jgi:hypothetical protein
LRICAELCDHYHLSVNIFGNFETNTLKFCSSLLCGIAGSPVMNSLANIPDMWWGNDLAGQMHQEKVFWL